MKDIVIDTSCIAKFTCGNANYKAMKRLVEAEEIRVHVPYVVRREFETQKEIEAQKLYSESLKALKALSNRFHEISNIKNIISNLENAERSILDSVKADNEEFFDGLSSNIKDISSEQALKAMEAYFGGNPPLTNRKDRQDIPDSFICQSIQSIKSDEDIDSLVVIANDNKIKNTFTDQEGYIVFSSLKEFLSNEEMQAILANIDTLESLRDNPLGLISRLENNNAVIADYLSSAVGEAVHGKTIEGPLIPSDDHEATISRYYEGIDIEFDYTDIIHYGNNQVGINFALDLWVTGDFYINKSDYYANEYNFSIDDWNDHYYLAESEFLVKVTGVVSIKLNSDNLDVKEINLIDSDELEDHLSDYYSEAIIKIESIDSLELIDIE